jgi:hypothetical protein
VPPWANAVAEKPPKRSKIARLATPIPTKTLVF